MADEFDRWGTSTGKRTQEQMLLEMSQLTSHTGKLIALRSATATVALVSDGARGNTRSNSPG